MRAVAMLYSTQKVYIKIGTFFVVLPRTLRDVTLGIADVAPTSQSSHSRMLVLLMTINHKADK
jgi:hypothetical protein